VPQLLTQLKGRHPCARPWRGRQDPHGTQQQQQQQQKQQGLEATGQQQQQQIDVQEQQQQQQDVPQHAARLLVLAGQSLARQAYAEAAERASHALEAAAVASAAISSFSRQAEHLLAAATF